MGNKHGTRREVKLHHIYHVKVIIVLYYVHKKYTKESTRIGTEYLANNKQLKVKNHLLSYISILLF